MRSDAGPPAANREATRYATMLRLGSGLAIVILALGFAILALDTLPTQVSAAALAHFWALPLADFIKATGSFTGWQWLGRPAQGDSAGLLGVALMAGCSMAGLAAVLPSALRRRDWALVGLAAAQLGLMVLAASGLVAGAP
jgi:hypothetical protein